jgi:pSer/pThr/pTyr-binding forkhead associated (FHA) protein
VNLSVYKNNSQLFQVDLTAEVEHAGSEEVSFLIGRSDECYIQLEDQQVSREHAQLIFLNNVWTIKSLSTFGSIVINGNEVENVKLNNGDVAVISGFQLNFSIPDSYESVSEETIVAGVGTAPEPDDIDDEIEDQEQEEAQEPTDTSSMSEDSDELDGEFFPGEDEEEALDEDMVSVDVSEVIGGENLDSEFPEENDGTRDFMFDEGDLDGVEVDEDDSYDMVDDDGEKTQVFQGFAKYQLEIFGEFAPFDRYVIQDDEVVIGRDPAACQLVLNDPEVSGKHAIIKRNNITLTIEDQGSGNGTILNGDRINKATLTEGDEFVLGTTTFTIGVVSEQLEEQNQRLMPVEENQEIEVEEVVEVESEFDTGIGILEEAPEGLPAGGKQSLVDKWKNLNQRQKIIYGAVGLALVFFLLPDGSDKPKPKPKAAKKKAAPAKTENKRKLTPKELEFVEAQYQLAKRYLEGEKYSETIFEINKIIPLDPTYKKSQQIKKLAERGLREKERIAERERKEKEQAIRKKKVEKLLVLAKKAVEEKKVELAEGYFNEILNLDPENPEISQLRMSLNAWKKEQERKAIEKAQKEAARRIMVEALAPGKTFYLKKDWHSAIIKLEDFLRKKNMDEDLVKEATNMLTTSKKKLNGLIKPLLGKARSLGEGQDLKGSYESYHEILNYHPSHVEALNEMDDIREKLTLRSRRIYREAIISESLSLFDDAKEKFQEVQQVSPTDSEYYIKATEKLKQYLD